MGEKVRLVNDTSISDAAEVEDAEGELPVALADDDDARADAAAAMQSTIPPGFVPAAVAARGVRGVWRCDEWCVRSRWRVAWCWRDEGCEKRLRSLRRDEWCEKRLRSLWREERRRRCVLGARGRKAWEVERFAGEHVVAEGKYD